MEALREQLRLLEEDNQQQQFIQMDINVHKEALAALENLIAEDQSSDQADSIAFHKRAIERLEAMLTAPIRQDTHGQIEQKAEDSGAAASNDIEEIWTEYTANSSVKAKIEAASSGGGVKHEGKLNLSHPLVKEVVSVMTFWGESLDASYKAPIIANSMFAHGDETSEVELDATDGETTKIITHSKTKAPGLKSLPRHFLKSVACGIPCTRAELSLVNQMIRARMLTKINQASLSPTDKLLMYGLIDQIADKYLQAFSASVIAVTSNSVSAIPSATLEAIYKKGHGINGIKKIHDEAVDTARLWCVFAAVAGAFRGLYQHAVEEKKHLAIGTFLAHHAQLSIGGQLDLPQLASSWAHRTVILRNTGMLLKVVTTGIRYIPTKN